MTRHTPNIPPEQDDAHFDLSSIFIAREKQLDLFASSLEYWRGLLFKANTNLNTPVTGSPTPDHKIQGLFVMLYGRGGFGKSTLLKHYRNLALEEGRNIVVSAIVDWEFAVEGRRGLFNPPAGQEIDPFEYFHVLCGQLAPALGRKPKDFRVYQAVVQNVEKARKEASKVLDHMQNDDRYSAMRGVTIDVLAMLLGAVTPTPIGMALQDERIKSTAHKGVKIGVEQLAQIRAKLYDNLGSKLDDYLDAPTRLALALGSDLADIARNYPLLIFFDSYEVIDVADRLLRIVMGAAGLRVGWVLAGRDNLWSGTQQRKRNIAKEYGYKDIVFEDRGLAVNFDVGGGGAFSASVIKAYFDQVRAHIREVPQLLPMTTEEAARIMEVTNGVPLAVTIAAGLYLETANMELVTEQAENKRQIVDLMVERYLLHARDDQAERAKLYGLAMLRRPDLPMVVAAALGLTPEQAETMYESELSRLQRRYSFIFTEKERPSLHQEVRHFLRLWLLERRRDPEIVAVNKRLYGAQEVALKLLEEQMQYTSLRERLQDDEWVGLYLDLTEQQFWLDPAIGVLYCLPFMIAASVYRRDINEDAVLLGRFFETHIRQPYSEWWQWANNALTIEFFPFRRAAMMLKITPGKQENSDNGGFIIALLLLVLSFILASKHTNKPKAPTESELPNDDETLNKLEKLEALNEQHSIAFPPVVPAFHDELAAALWWRLGEAYEGRDDLKAFEWYDKALSRLNHLDELRKAAAEVCVNVAYTLIEQSMYDECIPFLNRAIELQPDFAIAYTYRGNVRTFLDEYDLAIADYDRAIGLDPQNVGAHKGRGDVFEYLENYQRAIEDYDQAIELDPKDATTYRNRGVANYHLEKYQRAIEDYDQAIELDSLYAMAYKDRGNTYADLKKYERAIQDYNRAIELDPSYADAYSNRGMVFLWMKNAAQSADDYIHSYEFDPIDIDSAWMAEWVRMEKHRAGLETAERLEQIAAIQPEDYAAYICRGVALGLRGRVKEGLGEVEKAIEIEQEEGDAYFWKGMLSLYFYRGTSHIEVAREAFERFLAADLPPLLLKPLYWLEEDVPDVFEEYVKSLLLQNEV